MTNSRRAGIIIGVVLFAIVVAGLYGIIYAAPRIEGIGIKTDVVKYEHLPIADTVTALFVRDETLYTAAYSGSPNYLVAAGTKVRAGTQVVYVDPNGDPSAFQVSGPARDEGGPVPASGEATGKAGIGIGDEEGKYDELTKIAGWDADVSEGGVTPYTAIVSYYGDGWEKRVTPENIMSLPRSIFDEAPAEAVELAREWVNAGEPVYRITNNNLWRVAFWLDNADKSVLDKYKPGRKLMLDLGTTKVRATIEASEPRGRELFVVISSDMYYKDLDRYRMKDISVVFSEVSGAVIEKKAVKLKSGRAGVYVKQQSGTFKWVPVNVLKESGGRYLVSETSFNDTDGNSVSTIRYYDEIMSNPSAEGY